jgi:UDP-perosamine 4-acetyltransferase
MVDRAADDLPEERYGVPILGSESKLPELYAHGVRMALVGFGALERPERRQACMQRVRDIGFQFPVVIHPQATVASDCYVGAGSVLLAGAVAGPGSRVGENSLLNINAVLNHDCLLGKNVHLGVNVSLAGEVVIGANSMIGMGSAILQGIRLGQNVLVGAGAVVIDDIPDNITAVGVPARFLKH